MYTNVNKALSWVYAHTHGTMINRERGKLPMSAPIKTPI